ncbi:MAG: hypothetical protein PHQ36_02880 [Anaerolineales bacterium]|nr:hypothetical protein [Anaerolineales bacterium]
MKKALGCSVQTVLLLTLAVLVAAPLACLAALTAPLHSPKLAESFVCPPDTRLVTEWYQATWNKPGEKTLSAYCADAQGNETPTLPKDSKMLWKGVTVYFPYLFLPLLVIGALILTMLNVMGIALGKVLKKITQPANRKPV